MAAWAGLGYYSRARNLIACAQERGGDGRMRAFPTRAEELAPPARHRRLHLSRDRRDRLRSAGGGDRRQRRAGDRPRLRHRYAAAGGQAADRRGAHAAGADGPCRRVRRGADGSRRDALHAEEARLQPLPVVGAMRRAARGPAARASGQGSEEAAAHAVMAPPTSFAAPMARSCSAAARRAACWAA